MNRQHYIFVLLIVLLLTAIACSNPKSLAENHLSLLESSNPSKANAQYCTPGETLKLHSVKSFQILSSRNKTDNSLPYTEVVAKLDTEQFNFKRVRRGGIPEKDALKQVTLEVWKSKDFYQKSVLFVDELNNLLKSFLLPGYFEDAKLATPSREQFNKQSLCVFIPLEQFESKLVTTTSPIIHPQATAKQLTGVKIKNLFNVSNLIIFLKNLYLIGNKKSVNPIFDSLPPLPLASIKSDFPLIEQAITESFESSELWKYDGNLLSAITDDNFQSQPSNLVVFQNALYFTINDKEYGNELCKFDGKKVNVIIDIQPGILGSNPSSLTVSKNNLYFLANTNKTGRGLWKYDGLKPTFLATTKSSPDYGSSFIEFNHQLYFSAIDTEHGSELWKYDGEKISLVADINPGEESSSPFYFAIYKNQLFFFINNGYELWKYDENETSLVTKIAGRSYETAAIVIVFKNELYFKAYKETSGWRLWKYDGEKTYLAVDEVHSPDHLTVFDGQLYFVGSPRRKRMLWRYDGKNTTLVAEDIFNPTDLTMGNNALYFMGENKDKINILWKISAK
ncbi:MAG: hypothetical protein KME01_01995 [Chroococcus sp. CMT-3BRIN-NPC107]|jgi:ELWxxDGT repeat protein|nr:hypothetical protein [Chroococcus sp. CMT-3BRIN-NPC107]